LRSVRPRFASLIQNRSAFEGVHPSDNGPEAENNFDPWHIFAREKLDDVSLFDFHIFEAFSLIERPLPAYLSQSLCWVQFVFTLWNEECNECSWMTPVLNTRPQMQSPCQYRTPCIFSDPEVVCAS
jgi:hypothetical protein